MLRDGEAKWEEKVLTVTYRQEDCRKMNVNAEKNRQQKQGYFVAGIEWEGAWGCNFWRDQKPLAVENQSRLEEGFLQLL